MKKLLLIGSVLLVAVSVYGQGTIVYNNRVTGSVVAPVFTNEAPGSMVAKTGNRSVDTPAGTQTYSGALLSGPTWRAVLYGGPLGTADASLVPITGSETTFRTGGFVGFITAPATPLAIPGVGEGSRARLQLRAFDTATGLTYDTSLNRGASLSFDSLPLGGQAPPPNMVGLTAFNVAVVPEPSTIALGALGAIFFLIRRRK